MELQNAGADDILESKSLVDLSLPIYAGYTTIDGTVFLGKLRNSSFLGCRQRSDGMRAACYVDIGK